MSIELALYTALILHFVGDYITQNDWMARGKTKHWFPALVHALTYSLPFAFIVGLSPIWVVIFSTHYLIDRYRLATYWIRLVNWNWQSENFGFPEQMPKWLSVWLMIIIDNVFHLLINSACVFYHYQ